MPEPAYETATCTCGAQMIWTVTTAGKKMPVDAEPAIDGNVKLTHRPGQPPLATVTTNPGQLFGVQHRYKSHFATCKHAGAHRRRPR